MIAGQEKRRKFAARYQLPEGIEVGLLESYPGLQDLTIALRGLREWLRIQVGAPKEPMGMPSKAVGVLWRSFTLDTAAYRDFCRGALGPGCRRRMNKTLLLEDQPLTGVPIARTFALASRDQGIQIPQVLALPVLFTVDAQLEIPDGQWWTLNCGGESCKLQTPFRCIQHEVLRFIPRELRTQRRRSVDEAHSSQYSVGEDAPYNSF